MYCFEINAPPGIRAGHIYGSKSSSERRVWMQRIAENLTNKFSAKLTSDYTRMGWAYVREGKILLSNQLINKYANRDIMQFEIYVYLKRKNKT